MEKDNPLMQYVSPELRHPDAVSAYTDVMNCLPTSILQSDEIRRLRKLSLGQAIEHASISQGYDLIPTQRLVTNILYIKTYSGEEYVYLCVSRVTKKSEEITTRNAVIGIQRGKTEEVMLRSNGDRQLFLPVADPERRRIVSEEICRGIGILEENR
jgi:hypothetical protein